MKRLIILMLLASLALMFVGCGKTPPPPEPEVQPVVVEPEPEPEPPPPPPPPPVIIKAADFMVVYFDLDKYNLVADAKTALENNAQVLKDNPAVMVKIEGHCDERGTVEYNLSLGEKRANAAKDYMIDLGVNASRIDVISYGKERPADNGHNEAAWSKNRRAAFIVTSQ
ncbi:MAG: peptidoglycan-associated lipoprotein Pal [Planctomycetes bacterium]|nr:peptidoglycan-associated lipoprotein Pal [Planctomycetota bacterium]